MKAKYYLKLVLISVFFNSVIGFAQLNTCALKEGNNFLIYQHFNSFRGNLEVTRINKRADKLQIESLYITIDSIENLRNYSMDDLKFLFNTIDSLSDTLRKKYAYECSCVSKKLKNNAFCRYIYNDNVKPTSTSNGNNGYRLYRTVDSTNLMFIEIKNEPIGMDSGFEYYLIKKNFWLIGELSHDYNGHLDFKSMLINFNGSPIDSKYLVSLLN